MSRPRQRIGDKGRLGEAQTKLVAALREAGASNHMIDNALDGKYDDYKSDVATPIVLLVQHAKREKLSSIERRAKAGEFDGARGDSDAWAATEDGKRTIREAT